MTQRSRWLVSTEWLAEHLGAPDVVVVDGSYHLPPAGRDAAAEYLAQHIPGAIRFDVDAIADRASPYPHMLPTPQAFAAMVGELGIGDGQKIVVYDTLGLFSAARVWWALRIMGAEDVVILDGGLPRWLAEGRPVEGGEVRRPPRAFTARMDHGAVAELADVRRALESGSAQVVDARPADRFRGEAPEPRPGLASGHMPGSRNLPFPDLLQDGRLLDADTLRERFDAAGIDLGRPVITSCGSGVSAAILALALGSLGRSAQLYDGSWAEWGARADLPVATGRE